MFSRLPSPPDPFDRQYNIETWEADKPIVRVHHSARGATEFNPGNTGGRGGRFHPFADGHGTIVSTIYGSSTIDGALSETIFHDVPLAGKRAIERRVLMPLVISTIRPIRLLRLVQLRGFGLRKLGVTRVQMIESDVDQYPTTRAWCATLYAHVADADGLIWMSRQHDASEALVLFGTRVNRGDLEVIASPRPLFPPGEGWNDVAAAAEAAGIIIATP